MASGSTAFFSSIQAIDHGDHGDHSLHGDFIASSGVPSIAAPSLIMSHAVLSGPWKWDPSTFPAQLEFNDSRNILNWSPDVRTMVAQQEIASHILVKPKTTGSETNGDSCDAATDRHFAEICLRTGNSDDNLIASIDRPPMSLFAEQLHFVEYYADQRLERVAEITLQITDVMSNFTAIVPLRPERRRWTLEFIRICLRAVSLVEMQTKHLLACRRPDEFWPQVQPMIQMPSHSSYPSGHGTEAFLIATLLRHFAKASVFAGATGWFDEVEKQLRGQACRIAQNRVVAGVHFPIDNAAGSILGVSVANFILKLAGADDTELFGRRFDSVSFGQENDFTQEAARDIHKKDPLKNPDNRVFSEVIELFDCSLENSAIGAIYQEALKEWGDPQVSAATETK